MAQGQKPFLIAVGVILLGGAAFIAMRMSGGGPVSIPVNATVSAADTAGFRGYMLGSEAAPVEVIEYADFQCPACAGFAAVQFPDVKTRLIDTGKIRFLYVDHPLDNIHRHARVAAHAAACANDQGKFWEVEPTIYARQNDWAFATDAVPVLQEIVASHGVATDSWMDCMKSAKYAGRIQGSLDRGLRVGVPSTPTFQIGGRLYTGMSSDRMVRIVDSLIALQPAVAPQGFAPQP